MLLSQKQKTFFEYFFAGLKWRLNFGHFQEKITLIASVFPKVQTSQDAVR